MTLTHNFDFVTAEGKFKSFAGVAASAEQILDIDPAACVLNCRRAMEFALRWMYAYDADLDLPPENNLNSMMNNHQLKQILDRDLRRRMDMIRKMGNAAAHEEVPVTREQALVCLENLHVFLDFVDYCYGDVYEGTPFRMPEEPDRGEKEEIGDNGSGDTLRKVLEENATLRKELAAHRAQQQIHYVPKALTDSEYATRKLYLETLLRDSGWVFGVNMSYDVTLPGMSEGTGSADYLLHSQWGNVLALVELRSTCLDLDKGRREAGLQADVIEAQQGFRPTIFLSNGFDLWMQPAGEPERKTGALLTAEDLERYRTKKKPDGTLTELASDTRAVGRTYQREAVEAVWKAFGAGNRMALVSMAPGSGKTRVAIGVCKTPTEQGYLENILYLTDKESLVTQARRTFDSLWPGNRVVIATYRQMSEALNGITPAHDDDFPASVPAYSAGYFDLLICDEVHRDVYSRYRDIIHYFDSYLLGLTAIPAEELDRETYEIYGLEPGLPTYHYPLEQAVAEGYLVNYRAMDCKDYSRKLWEEDTIAAMLDQLMMEGCKVKYGKKMGKTLIFAINRDHCHRILEVFRRKYPAMQDYARVIETGEERNQQSIDDFANGKRLPQIAITSELLETGADLPELLNLVFCKKIFGKSRFWQMMGRGTRPCKGLQDGKDKSEFRVFDFAGNLAFFAQHKGTALPGMLPLEGAVFLTRMEICMKLQAPAYQQPEAIAKRQACVEAMLEKVKALPRHSFAVRQHLQAVEYFGDADNYSVLTEGDITRAKEEIAPLLSWTEAGEEDRSEALLKQLHSLRQELRETE